MKAWVRHHIIAWWTLIILGSLESYGFWHVLAKLHLRIYHNVAAILASIQGTTTTWGWWWPATKSCVVWNPSLRASRFVPYPIMIWSTSASGRRCLQLIRFLEQVFGCQHHSPEKGGGSKSPQGSLIYRWLMMSKLHRVSIYQSLLAETVC